MRRINISRALVRCVQERVHRGTRARAPERELRASSTLWPGQSVGVWGPKPTAQKNRRTIRGPRRSTRVMFREKILTRPVFTTASRSLMSLYGWYR